MRGDIGKARVFARRAWLTVVEVSVVDPEAWTEVAGDALAGRQAAMSESLRVKPTLIGDEGVLATGAAHSERHLGVAIVECN